MSEKSTKPKEGSLDALLEQDPAEIAKELEDRRLARSQRDTGEPVHEAGEEEPEVVETENEDAAASDEETTEDTETVEDTESETEDVEDDLVRELRERGVGDWKTRDEALEGVKNLRTKLSQREYDKQDAALGKWLIESGVDPAVLQEFIEKQQGTRDSQPKAPAAAGSWSPPHEWDTVWEQTVTTRTDDDGNEVYEGPPDHVAKVKAYEAYARQWWSKAYRNPSMLADVIRPEVRTLTQQELRQRDAEQRVQSFFAENQDFIDENRDELNALVEERGYPAHLAVEYLKAIKERDELLPKVAGEEKKRADVAKAARKSTKRNGAIRGKKESPPTFRRTRDWLNYMAEHGDDQLSTIPEQF